jgi:D-tagatose-1,6-bisphosphate aldolase subunit GatZ/KbaZ
MEASTANTASPRQMTLQELHALLEARGKPHTFLGVGPVSELAVRATIEASARSGSPVIFIASRNQVDKNEFGGGYLMGGMDQASFVRLIRGQCSELSYSGPLYIARDHGGPWQRDRELTEKYPVERAMAIAKESFDADLEAGFNDLHIDPTKCPFPYSMDDLVCWTLELLEHCEKKRKSLGLAAVDYEVGAEDIQGGVTSVAFFKAFIESFVAEVGKKGLPLPTFIVGQTGTLTKLDTNIGRYDREMARELSAMAAAHGVGFKEHNGDYLSSAICRMHPELGITGMNVAPEFGFVETSALFELAESELKLFKEGWIGAKSLSGMAELLVDRTFESAPWRKWIDPVAKAMSVEALAGDRHMRTTIAKVCGHYVYDEPAISAARATLFRNIDAYGLTEKSAEEYVYSRVLASIDRYIACFGLGGINESLPDR